MALWMQTCPVRNRSGLSACRERARRPLAAQMAPSPPRPGQPPCPTATHPCPLVHLASAPSLRGPCDLTLRFSAGAHRRCGLYCPRGSVQQVRRGGLPHAQGVQPGRQGGRAVRGREGPQVVQEVCQDSRPQVHHRDLGRALQPEAKGATAPGARLARLCAPPLPDPLLAGKASVARKGIGRKEGRRSQGKASVARNTSVSACWRASRMHARVLRRSCSRTWTWRRQT